MTKPATLKSFSYDLHVLVCKLVHPMQVAAQVQLVAICESLPGLNTLDLTFYIQAISYYKLWKLWKIGKKTF